MANEARLRADGVAGAIDADLGTGGAVLPSGAVLDANAKTLTGSSGSAVTSWAGGAVGGTAPTLQPTASPNGTAAVRFSSGYFLFGNVMSGATAGEVFAAVKNNVASGSAVHSLWDFGTSAERQHYPYAGTIYEEFGTNTRRTGTALPYTLDAWRIYNVASSTGAYDVRLDGASVYSQTGSLTVGFHTAPILGAGRDSTGIAATGSNPYSGDVARLLVYPRVLTTSERDAVNSTLRAEHFESASATVVTTSISSPGLADLPAVTSANHAALTLFTQDSITGRVTKREVVYVISHTAGATTATIQRGREGTTAQTWASGSRWVHGATARDFGEVISPNGTRYRITVSDAGALTTVAV